MPRPARSCRAPTGAAAAGRSGTRRRPRALEANRQPVGQVAHVRERGDRDREILDREPGRVEGRDLVGARPALGSSPASTAPSSVDLVRADEARLDRVRPARRRGLPAPSRRRRCASARARRARSRPCPGPSAPIRLTCWPGRSAPSREEHARARRHRHDEVGRERLVRRARRLERRARSAAPRARARVDVPERDASAAREERPRRRAAVDAGSDHGRGRGVGAPERLRREHRGGARAERRHGAGVEHRLEPPVVGVREQHEPARPSAARAPGCPGTTSPT